MTDTIEALDHIGSLENTSFDYSRRGDALGLSIKHIEERLGGVLTEGKQPYSLEDDGRYPNVDSLNTIVKKFNEGKIGLNSVPEGNEVKFRNALLSGLNPPPSLDLSSLEVGLQRIDNEKYPDLSGVTVDVVEGQREPQKYVAEVRFTRGFGIQEPSKQIPDISEGLLKPEAEVFLAVLRHNVDANKLTQGGNGELDGLMTPRVIIITPDFKNLDNRDGIKTVMENTGVGPASHLREVGILS